MRHGLEPVFGVPVLVEPVSTVISGDECWLVAHVPNAGRSTPATGR
jgi:hypothetical protein